MRHGMARLARNHDRQIKRRAKRSTTHDLATIQADGSLLLDTFSDPIPQTDYKVAEWFKVANPWFATSPVGGGGPGDPEFAAHQHDIPRPQLWRPLAAGDRVYVALIDADDDAMTPIVLARIVDA